MIGKALVAAARERPDVILLDVGLPDIDGLAVLAHFAIDDLLARVEASSRRGRPVAATTSVRPHPLRRTLTHRARP